MDKSYCTKCENLTVSKRLGRAHYHCEECDNDKSLSDVFWFEATQKTSSKNNTPQDDSGSANVAAREDTSDGTFPGDSTSRAARKILKRLRLRNR